MSMFKGANYVGQVKTGYGGRFSESKQPSPAFGSSKTYASNMGSSAASSKGSMLGKDKFKSTCKGCGGKM